MAESETNKNMRDECNDHDALTDLALRFEDTYMAQFDQHPDADWVMVGDETGTIYGHGNDGQLPGEEAFAEFESDVKETVHIFGRPLLIESLDA